MPLNYEISGDESWTHTNELNRYWCFWAGIFSLESDADRLETDLRTCVSKYNHKQEIKWNNLSGAVLPMYQELVDVFFHHLTHNQVRFRQTFLDRSFVHVSADGDPVLSDLDIQFRVCYQFLRHSFGLLYMPRAVESFDKILIRLDTHSSKKHTKALREFGEKLPEYLGRTDVEIQIAHVASHHLIRIGLCDVLAGAAGSYGNRMQDRRKENQRGMTARQKWNLDLAKYIYNKLRELNNSSRNKKAFSWFESCATDGDIKNRYLHKMRIWKFHPRHYKRDKGWQNDALDKQGRYQGPIIVDQMESLDPFLT